MGILDSVFNAAWQASTKGITNDPNWVQQAGKGTYYSDAALNKYFRTLDKDYQLELMNHNFELEKDLSSTAYQRAMADMQAAGLNPASLLGSAQAASTPNVGASFHSSAPSISHSSTFGGFDDFATSLLNSILSSSSDARKIAGREMLDNARHAHKMEEIRENTQRYQAKNRELNSKSDYYDALVRAMNKHSASDNSDSSGSGSSWLANFKKKYNK